MRALAFAWRSLTRRRARSALGILGIAAAGALMFDMLLLSRGLLVSVRELLDAFGFDVRVMASEGVPQTRLPLDHATDTARLLAALPEVETVVPLRLGQGEVVVEGRRPPGVTLVAVGATSRRLWTVLDGADLADAGDGADAGDRDGAGGRSVRDPTRIEPGHAGVVVNQALARTVGARPGDTLTLRGRCGAEPSMLPPTTVRVVGIASFPFESAGQLTVAGRFALLDALCEGRADEADLLMVASTPEAGPEAAVAAIRRTRPDLSAFSNDQVLERFETVGLSYFRQISAALSIVTVSFGIVLITVLLTVSVNQRLGEIAALRAIGLSRRRMAADVLWEAALLVGLGGAVSIPLGFALSWWLDAILRSLPGVPLTLHFFVFEPRALWLHGVLLAAVAVGAAVYPVWLVARLPIAATLRREFVS